jgi:hypothetical protein
MTCDACLTISEQSLVLPLTLECPYARHKYIEIHGVTLLNASDILIASSLVPNVEKLANEECFASLVQANDKPAKCEVSLQTLQQDDSFDHMEKVVTFDCRKALGDPSKNKKTSRLLIIRYLSYKDTSHTTSTNTTF